MPSRTMNVFVSYSHADASLVAPVVRLLRINRSLVFQDTDGIQPGKKWRDEIAKALADADLIVVFWCHHASRSDEVSNEWRTAVEQDKDLLPLLLDDTPLPAELCNFQWIDFRGTIGSNHSPSDELTDDPQPSPPPPPPMEVSSRRAGWRILAGVAAAALSVVLLSLTILLFWPITTPMSHKSPMHLDPQPTPHESYIYPANQVVDSATRSVVLIIGLLLLLGAIGVLLAVRLWRRDRRTKLADIDIGRFPPKNIERQIAVKLEAEILRRATSASEGTE